MHVIRVAADTMRRAARAMDYDDLESNRLKHLELIHTTVARLAGNSFLPPKRAIARRCRIAECWSRDMASFTAPAEGDEARCFGYGELRSSQPARARLAQIRAPRKGREASSSTSSSTWPRASAKRQIGLRI